MEKDIDKKFEYLNETKNLIKNSIINKGIHVSDDDTFRSYAEKIDSIPSESNDFVIDNVLLDGDVIPDDFDGLIIMNSDRAEYVINTPKSELSGEETVIITPEIPGKYNIMCCGNSSDFSDDNYVIENYYNMYNPTLLSKSANLKLPVLGVMYNGQRVPYTVNGQLFN